MFISKLQVFNYKSFLNSEALNFKPGINIIVGQSNSGKTALLEATSLSFNNVLHRSLKTLPTRSSILTGCSWVRVSLTLEKDEFQALLNQCVLPLRIPIPADNTLTSKETVNLFQKWFDTPGSKDLSLSLLPEDQNWMQYKELNNTLYSQISDLAFGLYCPKDLSSFITIKRKVDESFNDFGTTYTDNLTENLTFRLLQPLKGCIYRFYAERLNVGRCSFGNNAKLHPNASNLAEALGVLQGRNPERFNRFNRLVSIIFPDIKRIAIHHLANNLLEIVVWPIEPQTERDDLSLPLSSCGTGIGQVLAILYVVLTSPDSRIIIIDEPQSFLNPGAAKKLIEILKEFPQHQYFIATHSPEVIAATNPSTIVKLRYEDSETTASLMDSKDTREQRSLLAELGVSLSDVFGADNILWVEGPTEELCFPLVIKKVAKKPLRGTTILAIKNTGDLEGKRAHVIFDIYDKLSGGTNLFPPAIGFVLDREGKSERDMEDLKRRSQHPVEFIQRRMYENYLLHPEAIVAVINEDDKFREAGISSTEIQEWLDRKKQEGSYLPKGVEKEGILDSEWINKVNGATLLKGLFAEFSEGRVEFSKTKHSYELTEWLVENNPDYLSELAEFLRAVLDGK